MKQLTKEQQFNRLADFAMRRRITREVKLFAPDRLDSSGVLERILLRSLPPDRRR